MRALKKILFGSILFVGVLALGLIIWEPLSTASVVAVPYQPQDVRIARDSFGVPHIFGRTDADVAYGVAFAHAEDDFSTLQEVLAMTRGRLGAMTGADGAKVDYAAQLIDGRGTVARHYAQLPADVRTIFTAYAAGLNHYAAQHPDEVRLAGFFPVRGEDVVAGFVIRSPFFFGLDNVLGRLVEGKPLHGEGGPPTPATTTVAQNMAPLNDGDRPYFAGTLLGGGEGQNGSNAFAVSPSRGGDGQTRLVSNSHQPWTGGVAWYELVVHSGEGWDFAGATFPGSPFPFLGHNRDLGWTNTVNRPDLVDVYRLVLNDDGTEYRMDGRWLPLESQRIWLRVKWGPFVIPVPRTIYRSIHGPVIVNDQGAFAIRYAGIDRLDMVTQYYRLQKAHNLAEWRAAMAGQGVPATNFIYADREGNIGLFYNALFPDRPAGYDWRHILPGDTRRDIWTASLPFSRAPSLINPASGYIFNANNSPFTTAGPGDDLNPVAFDPRMGVELDETNRSLRALDLFEAAGNIDDAALARIKYDTGYVRRGYAAQWMARLLALRPANRQMRDAQALLSRWDWQLDGRGDGDALALTVLRPANRVHYQRSAEPVDPARILSDAAAHLQRHFGTLNPPLGQILRLRHGTGRGAVDLPLDGGNDTLRASTLWDVDPDGRYRVRHGDSFLMFIRWDRDGRVHSQSIQPFGAATTRLGSPHFNDQAPLFVAHRLKPVLFEPAALWATRPRVYRP